MDEISKNINNLVGEIEGKLTFPTDFINLINNIKSSSNFEAQGQLIRFLELFSKCNTDNLRIKDNFTTQEFIEVLLLDNNFKRDFDEKKTTYFPTKDHFQSFQENVSSLGYNINFFSKSKIGIDNEAQKVKDGKGEEIKFKNTNDIKKSKKTFKKELENTPKEISSDSTKKNGELQSTVTNQIKNTKEISNGKEKKENSNDISNHDIKTTNNIETKSNQINFNQNPAEIKLMNRIKELEETKIISNEDITEYNEIMEKLTIHLKENGKLQNNESIDDYRDKNAKENQDKLVNKSLSLNIEKIQKNLNNDENSKLEKELEEINIEIEKNKETQSNMITFRKKSNEMKNKGITNTTDDTKEKTKNENPLKDMNGETINKESNFNGNINKNFQHNSPDINTEKTNDSNNFQKETDKHIPNNNKFTKKEDENSSPNLTNNNELINTSHEKADENDSTASTINTPTKQNDEIVTQDSSNGNAQEQEEIAPDSDNKKTQKTNKEDENPSSSKENNEKKIIRNENNDTLKNNIQEKNKNNNYTKILNTTENFKINNDNDKDDTKKNPQEKINNNDTKIENSTQNIKNENINTSENNSKNEKLKIKKLKVENPEIEKKDDTKQSQKIESKKTNHENENPTQIENNIPPKNTTKIPTPEDTARLHPSRPTKQFINPNHNYKLGKINIKKEVEPNTEKDHAITDKRISPGDYTNNRKTKSINNTKQFLRSRNNQEPTEEEKTEEENYKETEGEKIKQSHTDARTTQPNMKSSKEEEGGQNIQHDPQALEEEKKKKEGGGQNIPQALNDKKKKIKKAIKIAMLIKKMWPILIVILIILLGAGLIIITNHCSENIGECSTDILKGISPDVIDNFNSIFK